MAYHTALDKECTFHVVYGSCVHTVNYTDIHVQTVEEETMSMEEVDAYIKAVSYTQLDVYKRQPLR